MATNRQQVLAMANTLEEKITDKKFFTSQKFIKYLSDRTMALTKRYDPKAQIQINIIWDCEEIAYTDGQTVIINANCSMIRKLKRPQKFMVIMGLLFHELSHILYTDFNAADECRNKIMTERKIPDISNSTELNDFLSTGKHTRVFDELWFKIYNSLEDGYIENRFINEHPASIYQDAFLSMRDQFFMEQSSFDEDLANESKKEDKFLTILHLLLIYSEYGIIHTNNFYDERVQALMKVVPIIDEINKTRNTRKHLILINEVITSLSSYIIDYLNTFPDETQTSAMDFANTFRQALESLSPSSSCYNESTSPLANEKDNHTNGSTDSSNKTTQSSNNNSDIMNSSSDCNNTPDDNFGKKESSCKSDVANNDNSSNDYTNTDNIKNSTSSSSDIYSKNDSSNNHSKSPLNMNVNSKRPEITEESIKEVFDIANKLLNDIVCEEAEHVLETENLKRLIAENQITDYGHINANVSCTIDRNINLNPNAIDVWNKLKPKTNRLVKGCVKNLRQILKDKRSGSVMKGLYFGKSISLSSYSRKDKKYFQNKKLLTEPPTLSVCVLIDESGSMSGKKITYAKLTALVIYQFCQELGIRVSIVGHSFDYEVKLNIYSDFNGNYDNKDLYRITQINSYFCNRDGYALKYCISQLDKENSEVKLCFLISDGMPSAYSSSTDANEDISSACKEAKRKNIRVIAAAIDEDKDKIKKLYGKENYLDISNLDNLPRTITSIIKKYIPTV